MVSGFNQSLYPMSEHSDFMRDLFSRGNTNHLGSTGSGIPVFKNQGNPPELLKKHREVMPDENGTMAVVLPVDNGREFNIP